MNESTKKNMKMLKSFHDYAKKHPWKKFWRALSDWNQTRTPGRKASKAERFRPKEMNKTEKVHIRLTKDAKQELRRASAKLGMGMSSYITKFLLESRKDREAASEVEKILMKFGGKF